MLRPVCWAGQKERLWKVLHVVAYRIIKDSLWRSESSVWTGSSRLTEAHLRTAPQLVLINLTLASDSAIHQFFSRVTELKSPTVMDVTGLLVFLLLGLPTPALAVFRNFHLVNQLKNWTAAQSYCREKFIDLATIESADDWTTVSQLLANSGQSGAWIGLYTWRWSMDNSSLYERDIGSWFIFETGSAPDGTHCTERYSGRVRNYDCSYEQYPLCYDETSNSYTLVEIDMTWHAAQSYCRKTYTDLASIRDQQEYNNIMSQGDPDSYYWIGLFREGWTWSDQSEPLFQLWRTGEPTGASDSCGAAGVDGMFDDPCNLTYPIICSAVKKKRRVLKVTLKTDGSVNLNDPLVQEAAQKQMEEDFRRQGVHEGLRWRKQPHGDVFNQLQSEDTAGSSNPCL